MAPPQFLIQLYQQQDEEFSAINDEGSVQNVDE